MVVGYILARIILALTKKILLKTKLEHTAKTFIFSILKVIVYAIVVITALGTAKVDISSIITAVGAAAVTAGLALQDTLKNLVGGIVLLSGKPFVAGDLIEFDGKEGFVDSVKIFFTTIHTYENKILKIPNSMLTSNVVVNCSAGGKRRVTLKYTVGYESNLTKVKSVIYDVMSKNDLILSDPEPKVLIAEHLDSGVQIWVYAWADESNYYPVYHYMQENVKLAFDENGITIPYPHVVVKNPE